MDNFAVHHRQLGVSEQVHHGTYFECIERDALLLFCFVLVFIAETEGSPPFPKRKDR